jgi:hypothetical protein
MLFLLFSLLAGAAGSPIIEVPGGRITLEFSDFPRAASDADVAAFVARSAVPVSAYYGKFPVPRLKVEVLPDKRDEQGLFGQEFHGERIRFYLGSKAGAARLDNDQILTHEMFHLGFPDLARDYAWVEEGLATYLAHLSRARVGQTTEAFFWAEAREGFGDASRRPGETEGFADEDDYHRMYWGGALFWFELDLEIRAKTKGARSLDTVTRALLAAHGTNAHRWSLKRLAHAVDRAAGFPLFRKWYDFFGPRPGRVDLDKLWHDLGVVPAGKTVTLDDSAPLAATRKALLRNLR